jgi:hypothetical protein
MLLSRFMSRINVTFFQIASSNISVGVKRAHGANHSIQQSSPQAPFTFSEWH